MFTRTKLYKPFEAKEVRSKVTEIYVHPEHQDPIVVTWDTNAWVGTGVQRCEIFRTSLNELIAQGWMALPSKEIQPVQK